MSRSLNLSQYCINKDKCSCYTKKNGKISTVQIGVIQSNSNGGLIPIIIRTDNLMLMDDFPGKASNLIDGIKSIRKKNDVNIKIGNYCVVRTLAEKHDVFLKTEEIQPILRRSSIIRKINHIGKHR